MNFKKYIALLLFSTTTIAISADREGSLPPEDQIQGTGNHRQVQPNNTQTHSVTTQDTDDGITEVLNFMVTNPMGDPIEKRTYRKWPNKDQKSHLPKNKD